MSRNRQRSRERERRTEPPARSGYRTWIILSILAFGGLTVYFWTRDDPRQLLREARAIGSRDPVRADELLDRSVNAAGGNFPEAQLERCLLFASQHRMLEALGCFSQIVNPGECAPAELIRLAKHALDEGQDYLAELSLDAARRPGPLEAEVLWLLIRLHKRRGRSELVIDDCHRLVELEPNDPRPWLMIGRIHLKNREVDESLSALQKAMDLKLDQADLVQTRSDLAELYLHEGNLTGARDQLERLESARTRTLSDRLKWAYLLRMEGHFEDALEEVDLVLQRDPENTRGLELRGQIEVDCGKPELAVLDLKRVLEAEPGSAEVHSKIGQAYQQLKQFDLAAVHLKKSRDLIELRYPRK